MSELSVPSNSEKDHTTLFTRPVGGNFRHSDTFSHFTAAFGDVMNVRMYNETKHFHGCVTLTLAESAAKAFGFESHLIAGCKVDVAVANQYRTTLLDLNDDCIFEILSMKCLRARDLCSVSEVCLRLKGIAIRVFRRDHKTCDLNSLSEGTVTTAKRILMRFGSVISDLEIDGREFSVTESREILASVAEHCSTTLLSLELRFIKIPNNCRKLGPLFNNLQRLTIVYSTFLGASKELFADCWSLVALNIRDSGPAFILDKTFPKLQQFECNAGADTDSLESFISRHKNLKLLKILDY